MDEISEKPVWQVLFVVFLSSVAGLFIGTAIGTLAGSFFYTGDNFLTAITVRSEAMKVPLMVMQGFTSLIGFFIFPWFTWSRLRHKGLKALSPRPVQLIPAILIIFLVVTFGIADSAIIDWNQNIHLPDAFKAFEEWARRSEDEMEELTKILTRFDTPAEFILALVVIGVIAGIAEEFFFRGILQTEFYKGTGNIHFAIWISAIIFSAIHMQFFGFIPRMLLGALFGYLYYWSGSLYLSMFAHFLNNSFSVVAIYLYQLKMIDVDMESPEPMPWPLIIASAIAGVALLLYFKKYFEQRNQLA